MTTPANPAGTSDLKERFFRDLTPREDQIAQTWLDDAWAMLLGRRPTLAADVTAGTVVENTVIRVLCAMVGRVFANPEGLLEESVDDYRYRRDSAVSGGLLYITPEELADVTPGRASHRSIRLIAYGELT
jgi:hypothetical protein